MKKWFWQGIVVLSVCVGCSSKVQIYKKPGVDLHKQKILIVPFENMTSTSKAGAIVSKLIEAEFQTQGDFKVEQVGDGDKETSSETKALEMAKERKASLLLLGTVTEFRYRKGFSENPAIGFTAKLLLVDTKEILWNATLSDSSEPFITSALTLNELAQKMARHVVESMR